MGQIDVVKNSYQVPDFLRDMCIRYETCPNLITTEPIVGRCPERCHQFIKPDLKIVPFRRGPFRPKADSNESSPVNTAMDMDVEQLKEMKREVVPAESEEDADLATSQTGMDDEAETVTGSVGPSRTASPEVELVLPRRRIGTDIHQTRFMAAIFLEYYLNLQLNLRPHVISKIRNRCGRD